MKYISWIRVSTADQGKSGLGLDAQRGVIRHYFKGCVLVKEFCEVYSGTDLSKCVELGKAIMMAEQEGLKLVIASFDRFRNAEQALRVVNRLGQENVVFCDAPSSDKMILTVLFAYAEKQAEIGRIKTKLALAEITRQINENGAYVSRNNNVITHLGNAPGADMSNAVQASVIKRKKARDSDPSRRLCVRIALELRGKGYTLEYIADELNRHGHKTRRGFKFNPRAVRLLLDTPESGYLESEDEINYNIFK